MKANQKKAIIISILFHIQLFSAIAIYYQVFYTPKIHQKASQKKTSSSPISSKPSTEEVTNQPTQKEDNSPPNPIDPKNANEAIDPNDLAMKKKIKNLLPEFQKSLNKIPTDEKKKILEDKVSIVANYDPKEMDKMLDYIGDILNIKNEPINKKTQNLKRKKALSPITTYSDQNFFPHDIRKAQGFYIIEYKNDHDEILTDKKRILSQEEEFLFSQYEMGRKNANYKKIFDFTQRITKSMLAKPAPKNK